MWPETSLNCHRATIQYLHQLHQLSNYNRTLLASSKQCGCFFCLAIFEPQQVREYLDETNQAQTTALCPYCLIDSVLPDHFNDGSVITINLTILGQMHNYWLTEPVNNNTVELLR